MNMYHLLRKEIPMFGRSLLLVAIALMIPALAAGCGLDAAETPKLPVKEAAVKATELAPAIQSNVYEVTSETYTDRSVTIHYPQISKMSDADKQSRLNQLIRSEALSVLQDYDKGDLEKLTVKLDYVIGRQNANLLSIKLTGSRFLKGTPYPTALFQSINLDMQVGRKLRLRDIVQIDEKLVQAMNKGRIICAVPDITFAQLKLDNNKLLKAFGQADSVVTNENPERAFSYFTNDGMGFSLSVIHALGDHVEFELPMATLTSFTTIRSEKAHLLK